MIKIKQLVMLAGLFSTRIRFGSVHGRSSGFTRSRNLMNRPLFTGFFFRLEISRGAGFGVSRLACSGLDCRAVPPGSRVYPQPQRTSRDCPQVFR